ncbi:proline--tRNA ligase [Candidatus Marsarchaeota archaeon]|nr:proline--tRNA ligase [Candidatus Marsarchaeota archaeon]
MVHMEESGRNKALKAKKSDNFSDWYTEVLITSEFVDYSAVSGVIVFRPDGYFVWDAIRNATNELFIKAGIQNAYFPLFIPEKFLEKEKEHVKGFTPEVAWVTHAGDSKLDERLAVRPTSETIMYDSYSKWIRSWRDLPLRLNQWNNVVRWEFKHPTPFLRSREFLWNEGHTAFATQAEADAEKDIILGIYEKVLEEYLALPGIKGRKTNYEKFAGALRSYSIEHLMPDGKAIQGPDFHSDGQNFSKAFEIKFLDREGKTEYVYQNTFAISTRELGVLVATHSDDKGLVIPPKLARIQIVIVPIYKTENKDKIIDYCKKIKKELEDSFRVFLDDSDAYSPGWKFNEWELKGVPVRIEIGEKEAKLDEVTLFRRDTLAKSKVKASQVKGSVESIMKDIHSNLYKRALNFLNEHIYKVDTYEELKKMAGKGFVQAPFCESEDCELKIKDETGMKTTNIPFSANPPHGIKGKKCIYCGKEATVMVNFAKSY